MKNNLVWKNKRNEKRKKQSLCGVGGGWVEMKRKIKIKEKECWNAGWGLEKIKRKKIKKGCNWDVRLRRRERVKGIREGNLKM